MTDEQRKYYLRGYRAATRGRERRAQASLPNRPGDPRKASVSERYGLTEKQARKLTQRFMDQLERCKDEASRRLLLGIGDTA